MPSSLREFTDDELREELSARAVKRKEPSQLATPDFGALRKMIIQGVQAAVRDGHWPKDFKQYIYEAAMESVYGKAFWTYFIAINLAGE